MDELTSSGADSYLWYQLGHHQAESSRQRAELLADFTGTTPVSRQEYDRVVKIARQWQAESERLQEINNKLAAQVRAVDEEHANMKARADACVKSRDEWKERFEEQRRLTFAVSSRANDYWDELQRYKNAP